jgi:hypothetical protein
MIRLDLLAGDDPEQQYRGPRSSSRSAPHRVDGVRGASGRILVTGAGGKLGQAVVEELVTPKPLWWKLQVMNSRAFGRLLDDAESEMGRETGLDHLQAL